ncbi:hypothetical protein AAC03nite_16850 [Alicyclobacillus acidoterrestris]|uniref:hypothetical protein n=1 Tax=Alicyclobacillus suci TaxID=2816080 RepID=UPI0011935769|nr:hypothetical protein [Alicyclobacillus suci]GEO25900.1 hypothetical protein AAC03nite_16850 [Alicyclobacillus acidoterrestris]
MIRLTVYDAQLNTNEWAVLLAVCLGSVVVYFLPRRFSWKLSTLFFMCGVTFGFLFDHVLSVIPISFYDVNDRSEFEFIDFLSYLMYGPVSYLFFYLYDFLHIRAKFSPIYILCWALLSTSMEWVAKRFGIYHYNHGYSINVSFVIYLMVQSVWVWLFYLLRKAESHT